jgi:hypothetical protein
MKKFFNNVQMDSETIFFNNSVRVKPCHWHDYRGMEVTNGKHISFKGSIEIDAEGMMKVTPYEVREERRQKVLYSTEHCKIVETKTGVILERWKFDPLMTYDEIRRVREMEGMMIEYFYRLKRKER